MVQELKRLGKTGEIKGRRGEERGRLRGQSLSISVLMERDNNNMTLDTFPQYQLGHRWDKYQLAQMGCQNLGHLLLWEQQHLQENRIKGS